MLNLDEVASHFEQAKRNGRKYRALCPVHGDKTPSLEISQGKKGILFKCWSRGCPFEQIIAAVGLAMDDVMSNVHTSTASNGHHRRPWDSVQAYIDYQTRKHGWVHAGTWDYLGEDGRIRFKSIRFNQPDGGKQFRPMHPTAEGWQASDPPGKLPLYGLDKFDGAERVYVCEGEKCAEVARALGLTATTSAHGARAAQKSDWTPLAGRECVILPDHDDEGELYAGAVREALLALDPPARVKVLRLPDLPDGGDIVEYVEARDSVESEAIRAQIEMLAGDRPYCEAATDNPSENAIPAPIPFEVAGMAFREPVPLSALGEGAAVDWLWTGYIAARCTTLLAALWKCGKSTLLAHLFKAMGSGGNLVGPVKPCRVLIVSEEASEHWRRRRDELGIGDHVEIVVRPFTGRPTLKVWGQYIGHIAKLCTDRRYSLVVVDTFSAISPVVDENDSAKMMEALLPLNAILATGAAILLVHHFKKGDGTEAQAARGSGALGGFVDTIVELRRFNANQRNDTRRVLTAYSRFDETPDEVVIELTQDGYVSQGTKSDAAKGDRAETIRSVLPANEPGLTTEEVLAQWPDGPPKPGIRTLRDDLRTGAQIGAWGQTGMGKRGDPHRYHQVQNAIPASPPSKGPESNSQGERHG